LKGIEVKFWHLEEAERSRTGIASMQLQMKSEEGQ
jgi:hypothetical protein